MRQRIPFAIKSVGSLSLSLSLSLCLSLCEQKLVSRRCHRFIFGSRCNREKYGTRINSTHPQGTRGQDSKLVEGARGDMGEAACPYEEVSKTRVKVADLMRSLLARPFILSLPLSLSLARARSSPPSRSPARPFNRPPFETDRGNRLSAKERAAPIPSLSKVSWIIDCFARARFPSSRRCPAVVLFLPRERSVP